MDKTNYTAFTFFPAAFVAISTYFITSSVSTLFFSLFILFFGNFFTYFVSNKSSKILALSLYNIVFSFYVLLAINHFLGYQSDWSLFTQDWLDEYKFYLMADENKYASVWKNFSNSFIDRRYLEYGGYVFYISSIASIAHSFFDGNHLLLQFLGTTMFGVLTSVVVFKILCLYVESKKAFYYTLVFMFLSVFGFYSFKLLRDIPIAFFYTCGLYMVLSNNLRNRFFKLFLIMIINVFIWQLRFEHGLFFSLITLYYCYGIFRKNKILVIVLGLIAVILFSVVALGYINKAVNTLENYTKFTQEVVTGKEESFAKHIYRLPSPIKQVGIIINSQIQPFPSWLSLQSSKNIHQGISGSLKVVYALFWFVIFFSLIKWIVFERKTTVFNDKKILILGLFCLLFLLVNSANMTLRRIIVFYPYIYLVYVLVREKLVSKGNLKKTTYYALYVYVFFIILYLIFKV